FEAILASDGIGDPEVLLYIEVMDEEVNAAVLAALRADLNNIDVNAASVNILNGTADEIDALLQHPSYLFDSPDAVLEDSEVSAAKLISIDTRADTVYAGSVDVLVGNAADVLDLLGNLGDIEGIDVTDNIRLSDLTVAASALSPLNAQVS